MEHRTEEGGRPSVKTSVPRSNTSFTNSAWDDYCNIYSYSVILRKRCSTTELLRIVDQYKIIWYQDTTILNVNYC